MSAVLSNHLVATTLAEALRVSYRNSIAAAKKIARTVGGNVETARNWLEGRNASNAVALIALMADNDEIFDAVLQLAGRAKAGDAGERARAIAQLNDLRRTLERLP